MLTAAGQVDEAELRNKYSLPIFTVSSMDFQKLAGLRDTQLDGPAIVWDNVEDTGILALRRHIHKSSMNARRRIVRTQAEDIVRFGEVRGVLSLSK